MSEEEELQALKNSAHQKLREAEKAYYALFCATPVGRAREIAAVVYERIRNATRSPY